MKQVIVNVPEANYLAFQELMQSLGYVAYGEDSPLMPEMEAAVETELARISADPSYLLDWREARKTLRRGGNYA